MLVGLDNNNIIHFRQNDARKPRGQNLNGSIYLIQR